MCVNECWFICSFLSLSSTCHPLATWHLVCHLISSNFHGNRHTIHHWSCSWFWFWRQLWFCNCDLFRSVGIFSRQVHWSIVNEQFPTNRRNHIRFFCNCRYRRTDVKMHHFSFDFSIFCLSANGVRRSICVYKLYRIMSHEYNKYIISF